MIGYGELGKIAKGIFDKNYNYGTLKATVKPTIMEDVGLNLSAAYRLEPGTTDAALEVSYKVPDLGLSMSAKGGTDKTIGVEAGLADLILVGTKVGFSGMVAAETGDLSGKIKAGFKEEVVNLAFETDIQFTPMFNGATVVGLKELGVFFGHQYAFNTEEKTFTKNNFGACWMNEQLEVAAMLNDMTKIGTSVAYLVGEGPKVAVQMAYDTASEDPTPASIGLGASINIDENTSISAKVNSGGFVGVGCSTHIESGLSVTVSGLLEAFNIGEGTHSVGVGVEFAF